MSTWDVEFDEVLDLDQLLAAVSTAWHGGCVVETPSVPGQGISCSRDPPALRGRENKQGCPVSLRQTGRRGYSHQSEGSWQGCGLEEDQTPSA